MSALNCRKGDLAVVVNAAYAKELIGSIVTCARFNDSFGWPGWEISPVLGRYWLCHDRNLRPLRNQPGQDETLTWADVPSEVTA